jgi:uncharacterized protein YciI
MKQYVYVLRLIERLWSVEAWTEVDNAIVKAHFTYLKGLLAEGRLILAGKTDGNDERTFGLVIFEANDEAEARRIMAQDPTVLKGIMRAELSAYRVALYRKA